MSARPGGRTSRRTWEKLYAVLLNSDLFFYKDLKHRQEQAPFHGEAPIQLGGCLVQPAEYAKRRHVLSLRLPFGSEFLLQCTDEVSPAPTSIT